MELVERAEECRVGDNAEPLLADKGGAEETGGEGKTKQDHTEEVIVV